MRSVDELNSIIQDPLASGNAVAAAIEELRLYGTPAQDAEGREYRVNEFGIAEPDLTSAKPGDTAKPAEVMEGWIESLLEGEKFFAESHGVARNQIDVWWRDIHAQYEEIHDAIEALHGRILTRIAELAAQSELPLGDGIPWALAPSGEYERIVAEAKDLDIDALTVQTLWSQVCLRQGGNTPTNFAYFALRLSLERHYLLRELNAVKWLSSVAYTRIMPPQEQKQPVKKIDKKRK